MEIDDKLLEIIDKIPKLYETDNEKNPIAYLHFFNPVGRGDWYVTELSGIENDTLMFGYVKSPLGEDCDEWGTFTLNQIIETKIIEFDKFFEPQPIKELIGK